MLEDLFCQGQKRRQDHVKVQTLPNVYPTCMYYQSGVQELTFFQSKVVLETLLHNLKHSRCLFCSKTTDKSRRAC